MARAILKHSKILVMDEVRLPLFMILSEAHHPHLRPPRGLFSVVSRLSSNFLQRRLRHGRADWKAHSAVRFGLFFRTPFIQISSLLKRVQGQHDFDYRASTPFGHRLRKGGPIRLSFENHTSMRFVAGTGHVIGPRQNRRV
jgi:hypothetical protein